MMDHSKIDKYHSFAGVPAMTSNQVHAYLEELGKTWSGKGVAMELGCWLGASSIALLKGLTAAGYNKPYLAFDAWTATKDQIPKAAAQGVKLKLGSDIRPLFKDNVKPFYSNVQAFKGSLPQTLEHAGGYPSEFCLFDAPKTEPTFTMCVKALSPFWIPGVTILGLLDYHFYLRHQGDKRKKFRAPVDFMEKYKDHFVIEKEWNDECVVFFRFVKKF